MKKAKTITVFILLILSFLHFGCEEGKRAVVLNCEGRIIGFDFSKVKTQGDRSYIPLNMSREGNGGEVVLMIIDQFEKAKQVKVIDWKLDGLPSSGLLTMGRLDGIWVTHKEEHK